MTVTEVRAETASRLGNTSQHACRRCGETTTHELIATLGGLCFVCYRAYCCEPFVLREPSPRAREIQAEIAEARARR